MFCPQHRWYRGYICSFSPLLWLAVVVLSVGWRLDEPLSPAEQKCIQVMASGEFVVGQASTENPHYAECRIPILTAFWRNRIPAYRYSASDCGFWGHIGLPDRDFHKALRWDAISDFRLDEPFDPPFRFDDVDEPEYLEFIGEDSIGKFEKIVNSRAPPNNPLGGVPAALPPGKTTTMLYIGAFRNGTDGRHFAAQHPNLEVHIFEPSTQWFQELLRNVMEDERGRESQQFFFHNYGVARRTEVRILALQGDASTAATHVSWAESAESETILVKSTSEVFRAVERLGRNPRKRIELLHINCEGCEYSVLPSLNFATMASIVHVNIATHIISSEVQSTSRSIGTSISEYCKLQEHMEKTHRRVAGLPFVWERWVRKCHWVYVDHEESVEGQEGTKKCSVNPADRFDPSRIPPGWTERTFVVEPEEERSGLLATTANRFDAIVAACGMTVCGTEGAIGFAVLPEMRCFGLEKLENCGWRESSVLRFT